MRILAAILYIHFFFASTGDVFPNNGSNNNGIGTTAWTLPSEITANDGSDATCSTTSSSQYLVASSFNFTLPAGAIIKGITVKIEASESSPGSETLNARLQDNNGNLFGNTKTNSINGTGKLVYTYGSASDLWGATITKAIVETVSFGVRFWYTTSHDVQVDYVTMAIEYSTYNKKGQFFEFFTQSKQSTKNNSL
jgi:hypothetical protein